ncbi:hypothetical protein LCGC14_1968080, partial [marine sediment metagenome]
MNKVLSRFLLLIAIVLLSQLAFAVSLESNGQTHIITQGSLRFETDGHGRVDVFRNDTHLGEFAFSLAGTINGTPRFLNSWDADWAWQVLSNVDNNITILGSTNWQGLEWEQYWFFSETEQKFAHFVENQTGFDSTDTKMYFVVNVDNVNVECINYVDNQNQGQEFCFEQDIEITQNLEQYLNRINFVDTLFNFQDLIDSGFEFDYLFAGWLNNANANLPSTNGFIIGVTKNNGLFPNGARVVLDPSIIDTSALSKTNYGNVLARDTSGNIWVVHEETVSASNSDIFVSKSLNNGLTWTTFNLTSTSDFNELLPHIDINSTNGLVIEYDKKNNDNGNTQIFVTTCSAGDCDASSEFLTDINVSACGATNCANGSLGVDVNDTAQITYGKAATTLVYRQNTGFAGGTWGGEELSVFVGGGAILAGDGTGVVVSKNGSDKRLAFVNSNNSQVNVAYFDGSNWQVAIILNTPTNGTHQPVTGFAGYDGNFYVSYTQQNGENGTDGATPKNIHFRQCSIDANCSVLGNWSSDLNVTTAPGQNDSFVSMFQANDLNIHILSSARSQDADANIHHYVRLPNGTWTTSSIADGNLLFSDANRTFNPLLRNREYVGSFLNGSTSLPIGQLTMDYVFLTSNVLTGDP